MNARKLTKKFSTEIVPLFSRLNDKELPYYVILPETYKNSREEFPVLYLLHGLFGRFDNWITNTKLTDYAENIPFLIICAEGCDSWYSDNSKIKNHFFESYLTEELIPDVEKKFRARANRNSRAIAGLSMGGYGAFKLAFRRPEMFCLAASMSGAFHAAEIVGGDVWTDLQDSILMVFGDDEILRTENDLFQLAANFPAGKISELPFFNFDCGSEDSFLTINIRLAETFGRRGIAHEFKTFSGEHNWNYWNVQIENILKIAEKFFK